MTQASLQCCFSSLKFAGIHLCTCLLRSCHRFLIISLGFNWPSLHLDSFYSQPFCCRFASVLYTMAKPLIFGLVLPEDSFQKHWFCLFFFLFNFLKLKLCCYIVKRGFLLAAPPNKPYLFCLFLLTLS